MYLHVIGADADKEPPAFGYEVSPLVKMDPADDPFVSTVPGSEYALGSIEHGTRQEITVYAAPLASVGKPNTPWQKICDVDDDVTDFAVKGKEIFLLTHKDAPRFKIIATSLVKPDLASARTVVPAGNAVITALAVAKDALYVQLRDGGIGRLWRVPFRGKVEPVKLPFDGSVSLVAVDPRLDGTWLDMGTWTRADQIYAYDPQTKKITNTGLQPLGKFDAPDNLESVEVKAKSYDGEMIPLSIVYQRGIKLDGSNPTLLWGYGAYGISQDPAYRSGVAGVVRKGRRVCHGPRPRRRRVRRRLVQGRLQADQAEHVEGFHRLRRISGSSTNTRRRTSWPVKAAAPAAS